MSKETVFRKLNYIDLIKITGKKDNGYKKLTYLSWAYA